MKYYIVAGEASGDLHGSNLMKGLYAEDPQADIRFWGGPLMEGVYKEHQTGDALVKDYRDGAVMGLFAVLRQGRVLLERIALCRRDIRAWNPDALVLIDYPGFNFRMAEFAHKAGFKVFYYIAPKVWASREGRIKKLKAWVDKLFIVFPFEQEYFSRRQVPYVYEGNPLPDALENSPALKESREAFLARTGVPDQPWIALLPGSRRAEIRSMMPVFMAFADAWHRSHPSDLFVIAAAPSCSGKDYGTGGRPYVKLVSGETYGVLRHARAAVVNSGTASLEAALIGTPQVVGYRMSLVPAWLAHRYVKVKYISLGNLILDRLAFREFLMEEFTPKALLEEVTRLTEDTAYRQAMLEAYAEIRTRLGGAGASRRVAKAMMESI